MKKRYNFMNVLRVLSMISIVFYHMLFTLYIYGIRQLSSIRFLYENTNMNIAKIGVGLFFILSGCGLMLGSNGTSFDLRNFYNKRFKKILIPFYIVYAGYFIFLLCTSQISLTDPFAGKNVSPFSFLFTILGVDAYLDSFGIATCSLGIGEWFLGCLLIMYLIYPLLRKAMVWNKYITIVAATIYYVAINILYSSIPAFNSVPMYTNLVIKIYDFILGMFLATILDKLPRFISIAGLILNAFFIVMPIELPGIHSFLIPIECLSVFLLFAGLEPLFTKAQKPMKIVDILAKYSYEYFLVHHVVIIHLSKIGQNRAFSNINILLLFLAEIVITSVLALLLKLITNGITHIYTR